MHSQNLQCNNQKRKTTNSAEDTIPMTCKKRGKLISIKNFFAPLRSESIYTCAVPLNSSKWRT
jgi:hypothetical protein